MKQSWMRFALILALSNVLMAGSCGTSGPLNVEGVRGVVGDSLPTAQGLTRDDQIKIDRTVARGCATGVFVQEKCDAHTEASAERWAELRGAEQ